MDDIIRRNVAALINDMHRARVDGDAARDIAAGNKLSRIFDELRYRYFDAGKDGRGRSVRFCWSTTRSVTGYFLGWREVIGKDGGARYDYIARKARWRAKGVASRRAAKYRTEHPAPAGAPDVPPTWNYVKG